jgi:hypothetical protein
MQTIGAAGLPLPETGARSAGGETSRAGELIGGLLQLCVAAAVTVLPVVAHTAHPLLGFVAVLLLAGGCAILSPSAAIVSVLFAFIFQNLAVSFVSGRIHTPDDFDIIRSYNFFILCITWLVTAWRFLTEPQHAAVYRFIRVTTGAMVLIGAYFLVGFALYGFTAIVYLRNVVSPLLLFQICLIGFANAPVRLGTALSAIGALVLYCGFAEFLYRDEWLYFTNGDTFWALNAGPNWQTLDYEKTLRETGRVVTGLTDTFKIEFFNSPLLSDLGIVMMRLFGPNMHSISFAYCLAFFTTFSLYRGRFVQAGLFFVLMFLCNAKGPLIMFLMVGLSWTVFRVFGGRTALFVHGAALCVYAVVGCVVGLRIGDFHVLGLMSGLYEFALNPVGHGLGAGGNYSSEFSTIDWPLAQALGRTPFPVESSVGVLLYQMGVFAFAVIAVYVWIACRTMGLARVTRNDLHAAAALSLLSLVVNGLFQEEAYFSLLTLTLFLGLSGMILGAGIRTGVTS